MRVSHIVVISLPDRIDRQQEIREQLEALDLGVGWSIWPAVDARPHGSLGCYESHKAVLRGYKRSILVLEDDAVFALNFKEVFSELKAPDDWELFYFGGEHYTPYETIAERDGYSIVRPSAVLRTHAYAVKNPRDIATRIDNHHDLELALNESGAKIYALAPWLVGQSESASDIGATRKTATFWNGPPKYELGTKLVGTGTTGPFIGPVPGVEVKQQNGTWQTAGTPTAPLQVKNQDGSWSTFGGGSGREMKVKQRDGTWQIVTSEGIGGSTGKFRVSGVVTLEGVPIANARVTVSYFYLPNLYPSALTDSQGRYSIEGIPPGTWQIEARRQHRAGAASVDVQATINSANVVVNIDMPLVEYRVTYMSAGRSDVNGPDGQPYPAAPGFSLSRGWFQDNFITSAEQEEIDQGGASNQMGPYPTEENQYPSEHIGHWGMSGTYGAITALSRSQLHRSNNYPELFVWAKQFEETVSWYPVPVKVFRDLVMDRMNDTGLYPEQKLIRAVVSVGLTGASFDVPSAAGDQSFGFFGMRHEYHGGTGKVVRSPQNAMRALPVYMPDGGTGEHDVPIPGMADFNDPWTPTSPIGFVKETESPPVYPLVWGGSLADLPHTSSADYNDKGSTPLVVEDVFTAEETMHIDMDYVMYQINVSEVPQPKRFPRFIVDADGGWHFDPSDIQRHTYQNDLQARFSLRLEFLV